jgi:hypothetical protein
MFNGLYSDPYSRECGDDEIYMKNGQFYDNETRNTVPTKKDTTPYDDLPISVQKPMNASCRCSTMDTRLKNESVNREDIMTPYDLPSTKNMSKFSNTPSQPPNSSKITLNISLTVMEIIEILILVMIAVLIAIAIRTRSRVIVLASPSANTMPSATPSTNI